MLALLTHYLTITVFFCHGLYVLLFVRPVARWVPVILTVVVGIAFVSLWFVFGGGTYTFKTLAHQAEFYRTIALTDPYTSGYGVILPATFVNVIGKSLPIWADLFIVSNGLGQTDALGILYLTLSIALGLPAAWLLHQYRQAQTIPAWVWIGYVALLLGTLPVAIVPHGLYVVTAALPSFVYLMGLAVRDQVKQERGPLMVLVVLLAVVPTLFLLAMSFRNGHTYGITQRYSGFSFPFTIILVALGIQQLGRLPVVLRILLVGVLLIQAVYVGLLLGRIYEDRSLKYTYFATPRGPNPHYLAAQKIKDQYTPGDTILYPAIRLYSRDAIGKTYWPYSIQDAQLTNMYLPKEADYIQRMDTTEINRIILLKQSGQRNTLVNLEGDTHRY